MKYQNVVDRIQAGKLTRDELREVRQKALVQQNAGDEDASTVVLAIDGAVARDSGILFMGFCPGAELKNRLDIAWKEQGVCTFNHDKDPKQVNTFMNICAGDLVVLKIAEQFGKTMALHGHGRVAALKTGADGRRYLEMVWSDQAHILSGVPMMACQSTVNLRSMEKVEAAMPPEFFDWLGQPRGSKT